MPSHFTFSQYALLLDSYVSQGLKPYTVRGYLQTPPMPGEKFVIIRHDTEWGSERAVRKAQLEHELGLCGTYYFHGPHRTRVFHPDDMRRIEDLGHEVGYHYETLDLAEGDFQKAEEIFADQLAQFRAAGVAIDTVCRHGNPRKKKVTYKHNGDLFQGRVDEMCSTYGLLGEAYESIAVKEHQYVSDVGIRFARWGESCPGFAAKVASGDCQNLYVLTHPDYWSEGVLRAFALWSAGAAIRGTKVNKVVREIKSRVLGGKNV